MDEKDNMLTITDFQRKVIDVLKTTNGAFAYDEIAAKTKNSRIGVVSAVKSLKRKGLVGMFATKDDSWAVMQIYVTEKGESI